MSKWPSHQLGELAVVVMGQSPPGDTYNAEGHGLPFFQGKAEFSEQHPRVVKWCDAPLRIAEPGDVLLSVRAPVGPTNVARERCCIGRGLAAIRPRRSGLSASFLTYYFKAYESQITQQGVGSTFGAIGRAVIESLSVPLPPLPEQDRIVRILDEAEALRRLREEAEKRSQGLARTLFVEGFGDPRTNPSKWLTGVLGDVIHSAQDGPHVSPKYSEAGIPFLSTRNVRAGQIIWDDLKYISASEAELHWRKCKPLRGDILYTKGGTTGLAKAVDFDTEVAVWVHIAVLKTDRETVDPVWLESMLNTEYCHAQSQELTHGIANRDLGLTRMVNISIYIPPIGLQRDFAARVAEIRALQGAQGASRKRLDDLFQSLLHRAFAGEL